MQGRRYYGAINTGRVAKVPKCADFFAIEGTQKIQHAAGQPLEQTYPFLYT